MSSASSSSSAEAAAYTAGLLDVLGEQDPLKVLGHTPGALQSFLDTVPAANIGAPEAPGKWSIRQVVQHLADAELVCGFRLRMVLAHERPRLAGYDQDLWASRLAYTEANVWDAVEQFMTLRRLNLRIWQRLSPGDLGRVWLHDERGEESLERMRRLSAGHDLFHLRQVTRIRASLMAGR